MPNTDTDNTPKRRRRKRALLGADNTKPAQNITEQKQPVQTQPVQPVQSEPVIKEPVTEIKNEPKRRRRRRDVPGADNTKPSQNITEQKPPVQPEPVINEPVAEIKNVPGGISFANYEKLALKEYSKKTDLILTGQFHMPTSEELQVKFLSMSNEELISEYNTLLAENPLSWRKNAINKLPKWVRNTGNVTLLSDYLENPDKPLSYEERFFLKDNIKTARKLAENQLKINSRIENGQSPLERKEYKITHGPNGTEGVLLEGAHLKNYQTSNNGCWSCFLQVLASSKGLDLTQEEIRNYRPDISKEEAEKTIEATDEAYNTDTFNNAIDMGDSILSFMPNTMLSEFAVNGYNQDIAKETGLSADEYAEAAYDKIKKVLTHAIKDERSPVGITNGKHFLTIVGIEGDMIKYKNSSMEYAGQDSPDHTHEKSIQELFGDVLTGRSYEQFALEFTYATEIKLSKDGKTLFGVPSDYVSAEPDGKVNPQPATIRAGAKLPKEENQINRKGIQVARVSGVEDTMTEQAFRKKSKDNVVFYDRAYIPKKLNMEYLRAQAEKRTLKEEERLRQIDRTELGMDRKKLQSADIVLDRNINKKETFGLEKIDAPLNGKAKDDINIGAERKAAHTVTKKREEAAIQHKTELLDVTRTQGLVLGFNDIKEGKHPELGAIQFLNNPNYKIENISKDELNLCSQLIEPIFGEDINGTSIIDIQTVLDKFTYKKTPDSEPVNLVEDVRSRIQQLPTYKNAKDVDKNYILYLYVKAEIMHHSMEPNSELSYVNGANSIERIDSALGPIRGEEAVNNLIAQQNNNTKRAAYELRELDIPKADENNLYDVVMGLNDETLDKLASIHKDIFRNNEEYERGTFKLKFGNSEEKMNVTASDFLKLKGTNAVKAENRDKVIRAAQLIALGNGIDVVINDKLLPNLKSIVLGNKSKQDQIARNMTSEDISFTPSEGKKFYNIGNSITNIQQSVTNMLAAIEEADNSLTPSSKQFSKMKKDLKSLDKLVNVKWQQKIERGEPVTFEMMEQFIQKSDKLQQRIIDYLDHKNRQMLKDPTRRNNVKKQDYEQNRIKTNINMLDSLQTLTDKVSSSVLNSLSNDAKAYFRKDIADQEIVRKDMNINGDDLRKSSARSFDRMIQLDDHFYKRQMKGDKKETLTEARDRIIAAVNKKYDAKAYEDFKKNNPYNLNSSLSVIFLDYRNHHTKPGKEDLKQIYTSSVDADRMSRVTVTPEKDMIRNYKKALLAETPENLYKLSSGNAADVPEASRTAIERAESIYGPAAYLRKDYEKTGMFRQEDINKLRYMEISNFKPIGFPKAANGISMNAKEFAAIAYAAAHTKQAYDKIDPKYHVSPDPEISMPVVIKRYTSMMEPAFSIDSLSKNAHIGDKYTDAIAYSREAAFDALSKYNEIPQNKEPLAKLIKTGIKEIVKKGKGAMACAGLDIEMAARMCNMLKQDPELAQIAEREGLRQEDKDYIKSFEEALKITKRGNYAIDVLSSDVPLSREERLELVTDYVEYRMLTENFCDARERRDNDAVYKEAVDQKLNDLKKRQDELQAKFDKDTRKNKYEEAPFQGVIEHNNITSAMDYKYPPQSSLYFNLGKPGFSDSLRNAVKDMVDNTVFNSVRKNLNEAVNNVSLGYGLQNILKNYKKAPKDKEGDYDIQKYIEKENKKKAEEAAKKKAKEEKTKNKEAVKNKTHKK